MRRLILVFLCAVLLIPSVFAAGNEAQIHANVNSDGSCQLALQLTLEVDSPVESMTIPLGADAGNAMLEGVKLKVRSVNGIPSVVLKREGGYYGTQTFNLTYTLDDCVRAGNGWMLEVPLLAEGLPYTMDRISFRITMPGEFDEEVNFVSGYLGENVDNYMSFTVEGTEIVGTVNTPLRDRESLSLRMETDPELFPRSNEAGRMYPTVRIISLVLCLLAGIYWLLRLRWRVTFRGPEQPQAPEGVNAGEICSRLLDRSADLPLMILSWAQAGYLAIHLSHEHTVTLHKRMDMGNERSDYESRVFNQLFGYEMIADAADPRFQRLRKIVESDLPRVRGQFRRRSGRILWVRCLGALSGLFAGIGMGDMLLSSTGGRIFPILLLGIAVGVAAWLMQDGLMSLFCWDRQPGLLALIALGLCLGLGLVSRCLGFSLFFCLLQLGLGLLTVFGGSRTDIGRQTVLTILGFRLYLQNVSLKNLSRIMDQRPGYYYDMAPYALALGVDRQFAARFGTMRLPDCMWLAADDPQGNRAPEWYPALRQVTQIMRGQFSSRSIRPKVDALYEEDFQ